MNITFKKTIYRILALVLFLLCLSGCDESGISSQVLGEKGGEGILSVRYIDVGQADSILVTLPQGSHMLIDAGAEMNSDNKAGNLVEPALEAEGVESLDVVIATHPHYDHIALMDDVIDNYDIGTFYLPDTEDSYTSATYTKMLDALERNDVNTVYPEAPSSFTIDGVKCDILAPLENATQNTNEYSIVLKMTYGENSFLFTGDAGGSSEYEMIDRGFDLSVDVLKVGHHGSAYSTTREFLDEVRPRYAVISCGEDNEYGHPHRETMYRLRDIDTYITKDSGDIVITSDGKDISVYTEKTAPKNENENSYEKAYDEGEYIGNKNSMVFHRADCGSLPDEKNRVYFSSADEAFEKGYREHTCVDR